ncbi:CGNR zinc finger domain-containing protein [Phytoactinopolyspora alkaliphila]|uniref:CGNR zinc finger domain-containing protein n=1 Tax=Phytoactinopolyspora alkaliphila TaxID=1783498 RepID=A0A6N9YS07_9ACTN|nr:CGNR zinc finger domain-containing protein [Phytoactinopolyspora alkaliphila]NED97730.1 CGNR zinc finger domain-containing protein [Phytoactinopolyspora alkaliphila]
MHFNPYGRDAVLLGVSLLNSPPLSIVDLEQRCADAGLVLERRAREQDLTAVSSFLQRWAEVIDSAENQERASRLNVLLREHAEAPQLTDHAGTGWHLHFREDDLPVDRQVCALIAAGTALHLTGRGMDRLGRCSAAGCGRVYADVSRNGRQRYCSPSCGNRAAVRRHRARGARLAA